MLKKLTTLALLLFASYALVACAGKSEVQKSDDSLAIKSMMEENQKMFLTLAASMANKNACQATLTAKEGQQITGLSGMNFLCNPGDTGAADLVKVYVDGNVHMAQAMAYDPSSEWAKTWNTFFAGGWDFAKTAAPWYATWKITSDLSNDYASMNKSNNNAWSEASGKGGTNTTTTTNNISDSGNNTQTASDIISVKETSVTDTSYTSITDYTSVTDVSSTSMTDTFGSGNTITGNIPPVPTDTGPPAP